MPLLNKAEAKEGPLAAFLREFQLFEKAAEEGAGGKEGEAVLRQNINKAKRRALKSIFSPF